MKHGWTFSVLIINLFCRTKLGVKENMNKKDKNQKFSYKDILACIIHEPRLPQMRGMVHEAVLVHREWATTKQMWKDRLAQRVKNADV